MNTALYLIFDMDGVIVDNHDYHVKAWNQFCKRHEFQRKKEGFDSHINGRSVTEVVAWLFGEDTSEDEIWKYNMEKEEIYRNLFRPHIKQVEGLRTFLKAARNRAFQQRWQHLLLLLTWITWTLPSITLNSKKYFQLCKDDSGVKKVKPAPEIYLQAAVELEAPQERCVWCLKILFRA